MIRLSQLLQTIIKNGILKASHSTAKGVVQTNDIASPFGIDANPYPGIIGVFQHGLSRATGIISNFINKFKNTDPGEIRIFSTDANGNKVMAYVKLFNDGTLKVECVIDGITNKYSFYIDPNGNKYETVGKDQTLIVKGNQYSTIDGIRNETVTGKKTLNADGDYDINGDVVLDGNFTVLTGNINAENNVYADNVIVDTDVQFPGLDISLNPATVSIINHVHGYISPSGAAYTTGPFKP